MYRGLRRNTNLLLKDESASIPAIMKNIFVTAQQKIKVYPNYWDVLALLIIFAILCLFGFGATQMSHPYQLGEVLVIHLDPAYLPRYAIDTVLRMVIGLVCALLCTFIVGTWAAKSRYAERLLIPLIDILQSVPVLGFLSMTIVGFIALFPGSLLGPECAVIFAIFTAQAWNMMLGFYQSLRTVPHDLIEAGHMFQLSAWQRFWRIEVPFSMPSLLWNMMMSMSASWFFVVASEAITVSHQNILLPGVGSYIAVAIAQANGAAIAYAILTMFIVILLYDQIIFRPLVAWSEKFKAEQTASEEHSYSWLIELFQRTRFLENAVKPVRWLATLWVNIAVFKKRKNYFPDVIVHPRLDRFANLVWNGVLVVLVLYVIFDVGDFVFKSVSVHEVLWVFFLGLLTGIRIIILISICSIIWVPISVWIGFKPRLASSIQPIVQFLASFPANLLFPIVVYVIARFSLNINVWTTPLMILGSQWYIVFNVIAGAQAMPKELLQVADNLGVKRSLRWRKLILPGIFPYYITGAITAAGGAWNASIVAEYVTWGNQTLIAEGLGAYIKEFTTLGDFPRIALGIGVMCLYVLVFNRLVWRPLYRYAETRYRLQ